MRPAPGTGPAPATRHRQIASHHHPSWSGPSEIRNPAGRRTLVKPHRRQDPARAHLARGTGRRLPIRQSLPDPSASPASRPSSPGVTTSVVLGNRSNARTRDDRSRRPVQKTRLQPVAQAARTRSQTPASKVALRPPAPPPQNRQCRSHSRSPSAAPVPVRHRAASVSILLPLAQDQRPHPLRPAQLVGRQNGEIRPRPAKGKGHPPDGLHDMSTSSQLGPRRAAWHSRPHPSQARRSPPRSRCWPAPWPAYRPARRLAPPRRAMRDQAIMRRRIDIEHHAPAGKPGQNPRRLRRARGEDDLGRLAAHNRRNRRARPLHQHLRRPPLGMDRGRVARDIHRRNHRRPRLGPQRCRRVPVQIGAPTSRAHLHFLFPNIPAGGSTEPDRAPGAAARQKEMAPQAPQSDHAPSFIHHREKLRARPDRASARSGSHPQASSGAGRHRHGPTAPPTAGWSSDCARLPETPPVAPAPVCSAFTVSSTAARTSLTRISPGALRQPVSPPRPPRRFDQARTAQLDEQLLQIGQRNILPCAKSRPARSAYPAPPSPDRSAPPSHNAPWSRVSWSLTAPKNIDGDATGCLSPTHPAIRTACPAFRTILGNLSKISQEWRLPL